jgi:hypothetical protein
MAGNTLAANLKTNSSRSVEPIYGFLAGFDSPQPPVARRGPSNRPLMGGYLKRLWKSGFLSRILLDSDSAMPAGRASCLCEFLAISAAQRSKSTTTLWAATSFAQAAARQFASRSRPAIANPMDRAVRGRMRVPPRSSFPFKCRPTRPRKNAKAAPRRENRRPAPPAIGTRSAFLDVCWSRASRLGLHSSGRPSSNLPRWRPHSRRKLDRQAIQAPVLARQLLARCPRVELLRRIRGARVLPRRRIPTIASKSSGLPVM